jgi:maleylpyruvate isomerase
VAPGPIDELRASEARLRATITHLDEEAARGPSRLPGWTRGHVVTHLARNADGLARLVEWAETGVRTPMYASPEARAEAIEAGSGRPAGELRSDLLIAAAALEPRLAGLSHRAGRAIVEMGPSRTPIPASDIVSMRIREVELHHVDLDLGYGWTEWSPVFALRSLDELAPKAVAKGLMPFGRLVDTESGRQWPVGAEPGELSGRSAVLLAWLTGRTDPSEAATAGVLSSGGAVPAAPPWG